MFHISNINTLRSVFTYFSLYNKVCNNFWGYFVKQRKDIYVMKEKLSDFWLLQDLEFDVELFKKIRDFTRFMPIYIFIN